jgi:hypothetical protein
MMETTTVIAFLVGATVVIVIAVVFALWFFSKVTFRG